MQQPEIFARWNRRIQPCEGQSPVLNLRFIWVTWLYMVRYMVIPCYTFNLWGVASCSNHFLQRWPMAQTELMAPRAPRTLELCSLAGAAMLEADATVLHRQIEEHLGIPAECQVWLNQLGERLSHTNLDMDQVTHMTVLHKGEPLKPLPECFEMKLVSTRRGTKAFCSTMFPLVYLLRGNVKDNTMILEPWRKNDHDTILYDMNKMTMTREKRHYLCPTKKITTPLESNPLVEFMAQWRGHYLDPATPRFWQPPGFSEARTISAPVMKTSRHRDLQTVPNYAAVPGWFVSPCEGCEEIVTDIEIDGKRICRMLLKDGELLRLAVLEPRLTPKHEDIEEYKVQVRDAADESGQAYTVSDDD